MKKLVSIYMLIFFCSAHAEVYKWVDEKGIVHYGDKQDQKQPAIEMQVDMSRKGVGSDDSESMSREEKRSRVLNALEEDRIEKEQQQKKIKEENARNRERCNYLKDKLKRLERSGGVYKLDKNGKRVFLSNEQRAQNQDHLRKDIKKYCN